MTTCVLLLADAGSVLLVRRAVAAALPLARGKWEAEDAKNDLVTVRGSCAAKVPFAVCLVVVETCASQNMKTQAAAGRLQEQDFRIALACENFPRASPAKRHPC